MALEPLQSCALLPAPSGLHQTVNGFPIDLASSSGGYKELQGLICVSVK